MLVFGAKSSLRISQHFCAKDPAGVFRPDCLQRSERRSCVPYNDDRPFPITMIDDVFGPKLVKSEQFA